MTAFLICFVLVELATIGCAYLAVRRAHRPPPPSPLTPRHAWPRRHVPNHGLVSGATGNSQPAPPATTHTGGSAHG